MTSTLALVLGGLAAIVAVNLLAGRSGQPAAVLLVGVGLIYSLLPGPNLALRPALVLDVIIPPLVYSAALNSSALELRRNLRPVIGLSVGLVLATALAVGGALSATAGIPLGAALALGAAVAPPDPVAALAIGRRAGLPARLVTLVEGEGLLNDATALTTLEVAAAAVVSGHLSVPATVGRFVLAAVGGSATGLLVAAALGRLRRRLTDPLADNAISLLTPFVAYLLADSIRGSGVLAVAVAGLWFTHRGPTVQSSYSRLQTRAVWRLIDYLLEGFVFISIGQQLPTVVDGLGPYGTGTIVAAAATTVGVMLVVRPVWLVLTARLPAIIEARAANGGGDAAGIRGSDGMDASAAGGGAGDVGGAAGAVGAVGARRADARPHRHLTARELLAVSWSGTRGVITLAAAFSIPLTTDAGLGFPDRDLLLFCAYMAVLTTLVGQGLTLGPVLRRLGIRDPALEQALLRNQARVAGAEAARQRLEELLEEDDELPQSLADGLRREADGRVERYRLRVDRLAGYEQGSVPPDDPYFIGVRIRRAMIDARREEYLQWRDTGRLPDTSLRVLLNELDHEAGPLPNS